MDQLLPLSRSDQAVTDVLRRVVALQNASMLGAPLKTLADRIAEDLIRLTAADRVEVVVPGRDQADRGLQSLATATAGHTGADRPMTSPSGPTTPLDPLGLLDQTIATGEMTRFTFDDGSTDAPLVVILPFLHRDQVVGAVCITRPGTALDGDEIHLLEPLMTAAGTVIGVSTDPIPAAIPGPRRRLRPGEGAAIIERVVEGIVITDPAEMIIDVDPDAEAMMGVEAGEMVGRSLASIVTTLNNYRERPTDREVRRKRPDGTVVYLRMIAIDTEFKSDRRKVFLCRDITERVSMENRLRLHARMNESATDFIAIYDLDGKARFLNAAGRDLIGYPHDLSLDDLRLGDVHSEWSRKQFNEVALPTAIETGYWTGESEFWRPDGRLVPVSQSLVVIPSQYDQKSYVCSVARDITERKESERLQREFVGLVSHELRTPMTSIRGSVRLLLSGVAGELPTEADELLEVADSSLDRLLRLVDELLDYQKFDNPSFTLQLADLDPVHLATDVVEGLRSLASDAKVRLVVDVARPPIPTIIGDRERLTQVLINLIGNAVKFSPADEDVTIKIGLMDLHADNPNGFVYFSVSDRGPGLPPEALERIFRPFEQAGVGRTGGKGTGLGLTISRSLIEAHGGGLWAESAPGEGASFVAAVPIQGPNHDPSGAQPLESG